MAATASFHIAALTSTASSRRWSFARPTACRTSRERSRKCGGFFSCTPPRCRARPDEAASRALLQVAPLPVVSFGARMQRNAQMEVADGRVVVGESDVDLAHALDIVVQRLRQGV